MSHENSLETSLMDDIFDNAYFGVTVGVTLVIIYALFRNKDIFGVTKKSKLSTILLLWIFFVILVAVFVRIMLDVADSAQGVSVGLGLTSALLNVHQNKD